MDRAIYRSDYRWLRTVAGLAACAASLTAQIVSPTAVPRGDKPPVVFLNGYQNGCSGAVTFEETFGQADRVLERDGRASLFFNNCEQARNAPIEELGAALGRYLNGLRYTDGSAVPQVDVVAHSMGGLIVRSYLSGKQAGRGEFRPPADVRIRKAVFLAVPFFGAILTEFPLAGCSDEDVQCMQMRPGSAFLYDLATWNQGLDDLREIDAVAVVADGGSGIVSGFPGANADDSTVSVTSASLEFAAPGRTRVVRQCHTRLPPALEIGCSVQTAVAYITGESHDTARILMSFLNGTNDWQSVGVAPAQHSRLSTVAGLIAEVRDAEDRPVSVQSATSSAGRVRVREERVWSEELRTDAPVQVSVTRATGTLSQNVNVAAGSTSAYRLAAGTPNIAAVLPSPSRGTPRVTAPGMFLTIYGSELATTTAQADSQPYPLTLGGTEVLVNGSAIPVQYVSPGQVNALMPDDASGLVKVTLRNSRGQQTVNVLVESSAPTLFGAALNAQTGALITTEAPARRGDYIALYLTGLGRTEKREDGLEWALATASVSVGGRPCVVQYAGRAPGFAGLDQVNCQIAADAATGNTVSATVAVGKRTGTAVIPVLP